MFLRSAAPRPAPAAERLPAALAPPPVPEPPDPLPKGMDPPEALPAFYAPLKACAEAGDPACQVQLGDIWSDGPPPEAAPADTPRVWNGYRAEYWHRRAAVQGYAGAFVRYGLELCYRYRVRALDGELDDTVRLEGLSWVLLSIDLGVHFAPPANPDTAALLVVGACDPRDVYGPLGPVSEADIASASDRARVLRRAFGLE